MAKWKNVTWGECHYCGSSAEVFTDNSRDEWAYEDDAVRCTECGCPGSVRVDEESDTGAWINWHDEAGCNCDWCKAHPVASEGSE